MKEREQEREGERGKAVENCLRGVVWFPTMRMNQPHLKLPLPWLGFTLWLHSHERPLSQHKDADNCVCGGEISECRVIHEVCEFVSFSKPLGHSLTIKRLFSPPSLSLSPLCLSQ